MKDYNYNFGASPKLYDIAKELRQRMTPAETVMSQAVRNRGCYGLKIKRQVPIGNFIVDFFCWEHKLVIEIDGDIHKRPDIQEYDVVREDELRYYGLRIIRFSNSEVLHNLPLVLQQINQFITGNPLSGGEGT